MSPWAQSARAGQGGVQARFLQSLSSGAIATGLSLWVLGDGMLLALGVEREREIRPTPGVCARDGGRGRGEDRWR